jgi:hypothetical protein
VVVRQVATVELPPAVAASGHHRDDCPLGTYLERQGMLYEWNRARYHDYDLSDRKFWQIFGPKAVPDCRCPGRPPINVPVHQNGHKNGGFKLHFGEMTAPVYSTLRGRLSVMLFRQTRDIATVEMDLDALARMAGRGSKSVLKNLAAFETTLRHR